MPASNLNDMRSDKFSPFPISPLRRVRKSPRRAFRFSILAGLILLLACSFGCAPSGGGRNQPGPSASELPELTDEIIRERINGAFVREVPEENGASDPINWGFDENEPKEITVVEKRLDGESATIVLDIKTRSALNMRNPRALAGQIRTEWKLKTGWALRSWEIVGAENISMKYKNLPKPPAENVNR